MRRVKETIPDWDAVKMRVRELLNGDDSRVESNTEEMADYYNYLKKELSKSFSYIPDVYFEQDSSWDDYYVSCWISIDFLWNYHKYSVLLNSDLRYYYEVWQEENLVDTFIDVIETAYKIVKSLSPEVQEYLYVRA